MRNQPLPFSTCFDATLPGDLAAATGSWGATAIPEPPARGPRILLTASLRWPIAARLAMAFDEMGCDVRALCPAQHPVCSTRAIRRIYPHSILTPLHSLRRAIEAARPDLVVPCDDNAALHLQRLHAQACDEGMLAQPLRALITRSLGAPDACRLATSRAELLAVAASEGIRIPTTAAAACPADLDTWLQQHPLPAVMKTDRSWGGLGVSIVRTEAQARHSFKAMVARPSVGKAIVRMVLERDPSILLDALEATRPPVTLQTYIAGTAANRAVACWQGKVLAGISVAAIETRDGTGPATVVRIIDNVEMADATARLVRRLGISGLWGVDFVLQAKTGAAYLIEMNPRATPICHLALGTDTNLPAALYAQLTGLPARPPSKPRVHDVLALFPGEWQRDPASPHLFEHHHDIPWGEPGLVRDGLEKPWADRGVIARLWAQLRPKAADRAGRYRPA